MLDREHIEAIIEQVRLQQDESPESFAGFAAAYTDAYRRYHGTAESQEDPENHKAWVCLIEYWGSLVKPLDRYGFRRCEVFANGNPVCPAAEVVERMSIYARRFSELEFPDAETAYKEFELIHPFKDGNGRVGMILWCIYTQWMTGEWPTSQPPDVFCE